MTVRLAIPLLCLAAACPPPVPSGQDSGSDLQDGGSDAGTSVLRADDELLPDVSALTVVPGLAQCLKLSLVHRDGTKEPILPGSGLTVTVEKI